MFETIGASNQSKWASSYTKAYVRLTNTLNYTVKEYPEKLSQFKRLPGCGGLTLDSFQTLTQLLSHSQKDGGIKENGKACELRQRHVDHSLVNITVKQI